MPPDPINTELLKLLVIILPINTSHKFLSDFGLTFFSYELGGKLVYQTTKKRASGPKCPVTGKRIQVIPHLRPAEYKRSRLPRNRRTVNRAYGGVLSGSAVRERIIRAFLVEEQKIVKKVLKIQKAKEKQASKS